MEDLQKFFNFEYIICVILLSSAFFTVISTSKKHKAWLTFAIGILIAIGFYFYFNENIIKLLSSFGLATSFYELIISKIKTVFTEPQNTPQQNT